MHSNAALNIQDQDFLRKLDYYNLDQILKHKFKHYLKVKNEKTINNLQSFVVGKVEAPLINALLDLNDGNMSKTARLMGLDRRTLSKKAKKYELIEETRKCHLDNSRIKK